MFALTFKLFISIFLSPCVSCLFLRLRLDLCKSNFKCKMNAEKNEFL